MAKHFHLTVAKVGENLFDADAEYVTLPGMEGEFTVLSNHEPFVSELKAGSVKIKDAEGKLHTLAVADTGIAEISHNQATVLL